MSTRLMRVRITSETLTGIPSILYGLFGLMFFVNNHPRLINQWLTIRETAIAHGKLVPVGRDAAPLRTLAALLDKAILARRQDRSEYEAFTPSLRVADDLIVIRRELDMGEGEGLGFADINLARVDEVRAQIPVHLNRRDIPPLP